MTIIFDKLVDSILFPKKFIVDNCYKRQVEDAFNFLNEFSADKIIYGINTGFGPMAQFKIDKENLTDLQYNLVRSHATGAGRVLKIKQIRAVMICRFHSLGLGKSGVSIEVIETLEKFINAEIYPEIYEKGGVGASGDLVQLAHLALGLIGEGYAIHEGKRLPTSEILKFKNIKPLSLKLRDGLALINGTSCMSGIGLLNVLDAKNILDWSIRASAMINELVSAFDDSFSPELNGAKRHEGQNAIAKKMREFLDDSKMLRRRADYFYRHPDEEQKEFEQKVQEYYSIRCVPQILGPIHDMIKMAQSTVVNEINSANDNPITDLDSNNVYHGGNFHGDYVSFEMDKLKIGVTKMTMLLERQLNFLMNDRLNGVLPPFLNKGKLGLSFGLQGMQFVATSSTAENQTLSNPMSIHSIPSNNDNQDIVSMGTNSALLAAKVLDNSYTVLSIVIIAIAQAIDVLNCYEKIGSKSKKIYDQIKIAAKDIDKDTPGNDRINKVTAIIRDSLIYQNEK